MESCVFWILVWIGFLGFSMEISFSFSRVYLGDHPNPIFVEVVWVKP